MIGKPGIYKITSPDGKIYIGAAINIAKRWSAHRLRVNAKTLLAESLRVFGCQSHKWEIIHLLPIDISRCILDEYEKLYIDLYKSCGGEFLNMKDGGEGGKQWPQLIEKLSNSRKGRTAWNKGKKGVYSEETIAKIRLARSNQIMPSLSAPARKAIADKNRTRYMGEGSVTVRLTESQVIEIRAKYKPKIFTTLMLSKEYGVSLSAISAILKRRSWCHI